jgi:hypothetical protein
MIRLATCPRCDYDLSALPARHRCPECGFVYDEGMFVLEGWHVPDVRRSAGQAAKIAAGFAAFVLAPLAIMGVPIFTIIVLALAGLAVFVAADVLVRLRADGASRALARYLVTTDGVARMGASAGRIYLWRNYSHVMLLPDGDGGFRLHVYPAWWRLFGPPFVNARLEGPESRAEVVRREIERRINRALMQRIEEGEAQEKGRPT